MVETRARAPGQEDLLNDPVINKNTEVIKGLESFVGTKLDLLLPVNKIWQPSDLLTDHSKVGWEEDLQERKRHSARISNELLVVVIGNTITEDALPNYTNWFGRLPGVNDKTGIATNPWALWSRGWTAEEYRHGVVLTEYITYSGRVNMKEVEQTVQNLLIAGFDPQIGEDPYKALIYTSHQEQATFTSHRNVARLALSQGDNYLHRISGSVGGDEYRHMKFYQGVMDKVFESDPIGAVIAMRDVYKNGLTMPGALMTIDGAATSKRQSNLFEQFADASIATGVFTPNDYVNIFENLMNIWHIETLSFTGPGSGDAAKAQDDLGRMLRVHKRMLERSASKQTAPAANKTYPWIKY